MTPIAAMMLNAVIAAGPATPLPWYTFDDYPMKAFEREWQGTAAMTLLIGTDGRPHSCTIDKSSGYDILDRQTCWVALKKARFTPARGPDGTPAYGVYRSQVRWSRPDRDFVQLEPGPDLEVSVAALPDGRTSPVAVKLAYFVDTAGKPSNCAPLTESQRQPKALIDAACSQLFTKVASTPVAASGQTVPTVRTAAVLFTVSK